ncbi:MAG: tryptophan 7-halogenase, partial [Burkholderiales bacterium]|nr:tryptophan 7-halogenase [Burkholderiales bacterium]
RLRFSPGYRTQFWHRNCVAVGLSAGFIEPLEASALALVELSAAFIRDEMPADRSDMDIVAKRFNEAFAYRWSRIIDFLKLHYVLSRRDEADYWREHRLAAARSAMKDVTTITRRLLGGLPRHRDLIQHIREHGMPPAA